MSGECFFERIFKVTDLGVVVSRKSGIDFSKVPRFAVFDSKYGV